jgi:tetratricopeptide (TPR) repeat protein
MLTLNQEPAAIAVAETLVAKSPNDPRAFQLLSESLSLRGEWQSAVPVIERAIAIDSASEPIERQNCSLCRDLTHLADFYLWWDSLPAAERTARRYARIRPKDHVPWHILIRTAAARGDTAAVNRSLRLFVQLSPFPVSADYMVRQLVLSERYDEASIRVQPMLDSPRLAEMGQGRWLKAILLRNQGRIDEALKIARVGGSPDPLVNGLITLESGDAREAAAILSIRVRRDESPFAPGLRARHLTWHNTLLGMALAAAGDTLAVRRLADTVEYWGSRSNYGRDRRAHHYLRGMLLVAQGRDIDAAAELREALHSRTHGFTRVNYELGKALMRLNRPLETVSVVRSALLGDIDGSNLYITRTELHELLAQAFDRSGQRDSAAVHYRAVVRAWENADPLLQPRRQRARDWLSRNASES